MEMGIVGLGRIGGGLTLQALEAGIRVVGLDVRGLPAELARAGAEDAGDEGGFRGRLKPPRAVFAYVPAGKAVDAVLDRLAESAEPGDVLVDGGNSYWGDSVRRHERLAALGIRFVDLGTSGGMSGARRGACFMAGGEPEAVALVEPLLRKLAAPGGFVHAGPPGAGHFTKLVHNGIEFGMLQAVAEGVDLLEHSRLPLRMPDVLRCWRHGSVIRSWLLDLMDEEYRRQGGLDPVPPYVEDTGEVNWLVADALAMERPIPVIAGAVMQLFASRDDRKDWARAVAMMRRGFGGHPYGSDETVARARREARVGPLADGA